MSSMETGGNGGQEEEKKLEYLRKKFKEGVFSGYKAGKEMGIPLAELSVFMWDTILEKANNNPGLIDRLLKNIKTQDQEMYDALLNVADHFILRSITERKDDVAIQIANCIGPDYKNDFPEIQTRPSPELPENTGIGGGYGDAEDDDPYGEEDDEEPEDE